MWQSVVISGRPHATLDGICAPFFSEYALGGRIHVVCPLRPGVIQMSEHQGFGELKKPPNPASCADALTHARARRKTRIEFARLYRTHACIARAACIARTHGTHVLHARARAHTRSLVLSLPRRRRGETKRGCIRVPNSPRFAQKHMEKLSPFNITG